MKNMIKLPAMILGLLLFVTGFTQKVMAQDEYVSLDTFYQELAPYGTWAQDPDYGYVWRPDVDQRDFQPYYTNGHWAMTEYGNTWVSDYDWGWAPFHYGRWIRNRFSEWIWIPDTVWGPAWVTWRSGGGYYGWAPLGPGYDIEENADEGGYNIPNDWWVFIPQINIYNNSYPHYYNRNLNIFNQTTYINYTYGRNRHNFYTGPRAEDIRRVTRRDVRVYQVAHSSRPGRTSISNNNTINIYNPGSGRRGNNTPNGTGFGGNNNTVNGRNGRGNNQNPGQPAGNTNPVVNGQNGQPGRGGRGNNQNPGQPAGNTNPVVNGQNGQPGRDGRGNNQNPGQPAGNTNPVVNGQNGQPGRDGRGNNQTPGQPAGNTNPVVNGQNGSNPGRRNDMGVRPSVDGRDRTQRIQQGGDAQQQQQAQQQAQQQRQQQMQQQQRDGQQRQQQAQQHQQQAQQQAQQQQQRQQQMQQQQRDGQQRQQQQAQQQAQQQQQRQQQAQQQQQNQQRQQQAQQQQQRQQQAQQQAQQRQQQQQQRQQQEQQRQQQQQQQAPPDRGGRGN